MSNIRLRADILMLLAGGLFTSGSTLRIQRVALRTGLSGPH